MDMATISLTDTRFIQQGSDEVVLEITTGFMQAGGSFVVFSDTQGLKNEILPNANGKYIIRPTLHCFLNCITSVQDINPSTNKTSVSHDFSPASPGAFKYSRQVEHHNDIVIYDILYIFV
jgi:hypothetical protein